jgi:mono/diheme cytochrome c family protein
LPIHGYGRIRALTIGPDGYLYFSTSQKDPPEGTPKPGDDMILRIRPAASFKNAVAGSKITNSNENTATATQKNIAAVKYTQLCAACHGTKMQGTRKAQSLIDGKWNYGAGRSNIIKNIRQGITDKGMPAWDGALRKEEIEMLADYILAKEKAAHK